MRDINNIHIEDVVYALFIEIGLSVDNKNLIYDINNGIRLQYENRHITASIDSNRPTYGSSVYYLFDPISNGKFMKYILGYYLTKEEYLNNIQCISFVDQIENIEKYSIDNKIRRTRVVVDLYNNGEYISEYYYQKGLKYTDIILRIGGNNIYNILYKFDSIPEEYNNRDTGRKQYGEYNNGLVINYGGTAEENIQKALRDINNNKKRI